MYSKYTRIICKNISCDDELLLLLLFDYFVIDLLFYYLIVVLCNVDLFVLFLGSYDNKFILNK